MTWASAPAAAPDRTEALTGCAVVFPGQGSQRPQMALPWQDHPAARLWQVADALLGRDITRLGVVADAEELREPANCQIALYLHHAVLFSVWADAGGRAATAAGHSLGEYNALQAAGVVTFEEGLRLVDERARATSAAAHANPGGMIACLGGDADALRSLCDEAGAWVANDNADGQLVISGTDEALERFSGAAARQRAKVVRLGVGAAYHSPLMAPAAGPLRAALDRTTFHDGAIPVVANVDAEPHRNAGEWPDLLEVQLTAPVRWRETLLTLAGAGVTELVELGASAVLTGLAKRVTPALRRRAITTPQDLEAT